MTSLNLLFLEHRRNTMKLITMYKIINGILVYLQMACNLITTHQEKDTAINFDSCTVTNIMIWPKMMDPLRLLLNFKGAESA